MYKGDLVRIRSLDVVHNNWLRSSNYFDKIGVVIRVSSLMSTVDVMIDGSVQKFRSSDVQLVKRSIENKRRLMMLSKIKYFPYQVYCDMDGVLVDFEGAASKSITEALEHPPEALESLCRAVEREYGSKVDLTEIKQYNKPRLPELKLLIGKLFEWDKQWWADLPFLEEGKKLWSVLSKMEPAPILLTTPMDHNGGSASAEGKVLWVQKNLNPLGTIRWEKTMTLSHEKFKYAVNSDTLQRAVLIDDFPKNVDPFNNCGGIGILHKGNSDDTLSSLVEVVNDFSG